MVAFADAEPVPGVIWIAMRAITGNTAACATGFWKHQAFVDTFQIKPGQANVTNVRDGILDGTHDGVQQMFAEVHGHGLGNEQSLLGLKRLRENGCPHKLYLAESTTATTKLNKFFGTNQWGWADQRGQAAFAAPRGHRGSAMWQ
jgi:hypothetical protein